MTVPHFSFNKERNRRKFMKKKLNAKKRNKKVEITDVAIRKVAYVRYKNFTDEQNDIMHELAKDVLLLSQQYNNSNEVAITCDICADTPLESYGVCYGDEHSVDICSDTLSNHIISSNGEMTVVVMHNHPSTQTFSLEDIFFFLSYATVRVIVVVSNQGTVHYLYKDSSYDHSNAFVLFRECTNQIKKRSSAKASYLASLTFLVRCSEVGLFYS